VETVLVKRAVGYCRNSECGQLFKGVFLLNPGDTFYCPNCRVDGFFVGERGEAKNNKEVFKEVRVNYNFDPSRMEYRNLAIVRDESLGKDTNVYTLYSPLIKTDKRALKVAESILSNLMMSNGNLTQGKMPRTTENVLQFDGSLSEFKQQLKKLEEQLAKSNLLERQ
jgi:hypothetical protein